MNPTEPDAPKSSSRTPPKHRSFFVTGFPGFIGKRLVPELCRVHTDATVHLLVQDKFLEDAKRYIQGLPRGQQVEVLTGDIVDMHLGLSSQEYNRLCDEVTDIFHLAAISYLGLPHEVAERVNVEGTRNVLELARDVSQLNRFNHFSTCYVSGDRLGVIAEDELEMGQQFRNAYEETKFQAERLIRRAHANGLPTSIYRPSIVVGDSQTGEIDRFEGPYYLGILLVTSPLSVPLPLPGNGVAPLNVVPVDFVVRAVVALADDARGVGRTFHLVDPNPMSSRRVYELIAEKANKRLPKLTVPHRAADVLMRLPGVEKLVRPQRAAISYVNHLAIYNCHNTLELLDGKNIRCPPLTSYLDTLVSYVREFYQKRQHEQGQVDDPLDVPDKADA
jgi:thioester reductase-like protein